MWFQSMSLFIMYLLLLLASVINTGLSNENIVAANHAPWLINYPEEFKAKNHLSSHLIDERNNSERLKLYQENGELFNGMTTASDGENVDSVDHFFWGQTNGLSIELGGLDGSVKTNSQTANLVKLGWDRIIIEGNPEHRENMKLNSPDAFTVNAVICEKFGKVHYAKSNYVSGILEFMEIKFLSEFHREIFDSGIPAGNLTSVDWTKHNNVVEVVCIPLSHILHKAKVHHVNFFLLDVEGGELNVLKSINWKTIKFDVLCVETEPDQRPPGFAEDVTNYLNEKGYVNVTGQYGRNIWYTRRDFIPIKRPGLDPACFNGHRKFMSLVHMYLGEKGAQWKNFQRCSLDNPL